MGGDATTDPGTSVLEIATRSGRVEIWARPGAATEVLEGDAQLDGSGRILGSGAGRVKVACPEGVDVVIGTTSGRVDCHGRLGRVAITNTTGRVTVEHAREAEVRTTSGRVSIERCEGLARVVVTSGSVHIGHADAIDATTDSGRTTVDAVGDATVRVGTGRVEIGLVRAGRVDVRAQTGRVTVTVPEGIHPALALTTRNGKITCDVEPGDDGSLAAETGTGSIRVARG